MNMPTWRWTVRGTQLSASTGAQERPFDETGVVEAESAGEAIHWFVEHGWWEMDQDRAVTIKVEPLDSLEEVE